MMPETTSLFVLGSFVVACSAKVARLPERGESLKAETFTVEPGGKGLNLALGAFRLGATVDGLLPIGNDLFAQLAEQAIAQTGLPLRMLRRFEAMTGSGIGFSDLQGENCLAVHPGANLLLGARDVQSTAESLGNAALVMAQFEVGDEPVLEAFSLATQAGVHTLLNPSPFRPVDPRILNRTSILVVNEVEASQMAEALGLPADEARSIRLAALARALLERGVDTVVVTLGSAGVVAYQSGTSPLSQPAFSVDAIDTLGAGDAFTAGLATALVKGRSLEESLTVARACGAITCRRVGVFDVLPTSVRVDEFLLEHGCKTLS